MRRTTQTVHRVSYKRTKKSTVRSKQFLTAAKAQSYIAALRESGTFADTAINRKRRIAGLDYEPCVWIGLETGQTTWDELIDVTDEDVPRPGRRKRKATTAATLAKMQPTHLKFDTSAVCEAICEFWEHEALETLAEDLCQIGGDLDAIDIDDDFSYMALAEAISQMSRDGYELDHIMQRLVKGTTTAWDD